MTQTPDITVVIPTLNRGAVLVNTIDYLREISDSVQIIAVDQTLEHESETQDTLDSYQTSGKFQWLRLKHPSVVAAMNQGLLAANTEFVLFLDDDIKPFEGLLSALCSAIEKQGPTAVIAGRVIESWDDPDGVVDNSKDKFSLNGLNDCLAPVFKGGNFTVKRSIAIELGGFDENFKGTAHDYEREFADRVLYSGHSIHYCAAAGIYHLKVDSGGIRTYGHFLKTAKPHHAVGAYYYILTSRLIENKTTEIIKRLLQRVATKTHLKQPWWIPLTLVGDFLGLIWAAYLRISGPSLIDKNKGRAADQSK